MSGWPWGRMDTGSSATLSGPTRCIGALRDGTPRLRLPHQYQNRRGELVQSWYQVDLTDLEAITQTNEASNTTREMHVFRRMSLAVVPPSPPPEDDIPEDDAADSQNAGDGRQNAGDGRDDGGGDEDEVLDDPSFLEQVDQ